MDSESHPEIAAPKSGGISGKISEPLSDDDTSAPHVVPTSSRLGARVAYRSRGSGLGPGVESGRMNFFWLELSAD